MLTLQNDSASMHKPMQLLQYANSVKESRKIKELRLRFVFTKGTLNLYQEEGEVYKLS